MKNSEMVTLKLSVPKSKVRKVKAMLKKEGVEIIEVKPSDIGPYGLRKGNFKPGEKPSEAIKRIADRKQEDFLKIRRKAWGGRGVK